VELVDAGWNVLAGAHAVRIGKATKNILSDWCPPAQISPYGHGDAAFKVLDVLFILEGAN